MRPIRSTVVLCAEPHLHELLYFNLKEERGLFIRLLNELYVTGAKPAEIAFPVEGFLLTDVALLIRGNWEQHRFRIDSITVSEPDGHVTAFEARRDGER